LPHDEDTGGFFVAALRKKVSDISAEAHAVLAVAEGAEESVGGETADDDKREGEGEEEGKKKSFYRHQKNPIDLLQWDDESFQMVRARCHHCMLCCAVHRFHALLEYK
jgi:hypothetical protein